MSWNTHEEISRAAGPYVDDIIGTHERGDDMAGLCLACGDMCDGVEPDAERYRCEACGERAVFGCGELIFYVIG